MHEHEELYDVRITSPALSIGARAKYKYSDSIAKKLLRVTRFGDPYSLYEQVAGDIYVPRGIATIGPDTVDKRVQGRRCGFVSKIKPRNAEQARLMDESEALLRQGTDFILRAGTGQGKSILGLEAAARLNVPTLVVVPESSLMDQWIERAHQFLDVPKNRIGIIQQDTCDYQGKWLVIGMLQSLSLKEDYPREMYNQFGLVVIDELHKCGGDELSRVLGLFPAKHRYGLSATPDRSDGKELLIQAHVGPIMITSDSTPMGFKVLRYTSTWACPRREVIENGYKYFKRIDHTPKTAGHVINHLAKHDTTNKKVAGFIKKAYDKGRYIMVFSDRIRHLEELMTQSARKGVPSHEMQLYIGGVSKAAIKKAKSARVIFGTYQKLGTGVDIPWFSVAVLATPRAQVKQVVGRILREHPDKGQPIVFDVNFDDSPVFKSYGMARDRYYEEVGASVKYIS